MTIYLLFTFNFHPNKEIKEAKIDGEKITFQK